MSETVPAPSAELLEKYAALKEYFKAAGSAAVAFSGGVDSTFLLYAAKEALGDKVTAVTAISGAFPERERTEAADYCTSLGVRQLFCTINELEIPGFADNPPDRCYTCKRCIFSGLLELSRNEGAAVLAEGSNLDDLGDYRPGLRAIAELGVKSPLREIGFTKSEIRILSHFLGLPTWKKPSFACLATRFVYGEKITPEKLKMVENAEALLLGLGFTQVRVRIHGTMARIEILPDELPRLVEKDCRTLVWTKLREYGFSYVSADLGGYRTGSMNDPILKN